MSVIASQITSLAIVYSTVYSGAVQRKHQSSASLALVRGIHRWPVNTGTRLRASGPEICTQDSVENGLIVTLFRVDSRFVPSQWETALLCNGVSDWLGASLESALMFSMYFSYCYNHAKAWIKCFLPRIVLRMLFSTQYNAVYWFLRIFGCEQWIDAQLLNMRCGSNKDHIVVSLCKKSTGDRIFAKIQFLVLRRWRNCWYSQLGPGLLKKFHVKIQDFQTWHLIGW